MYEYFGFALQMVNLHDLGSRTKLNKSKTLGAILEKCQKWPNCMKWVVLIKWKINLDQDRVKNLENGKLLKCSCILVFL